MKTSFTIIFVLFFFAALSQDTLKVHFLYGSKPKKDHKDTEQKWFGGVWGGHVGIEADRGKILSFIPNGEFHLFAKNKDKHSMFAEHNSKSFYEILGGISDSVKRAVVFIPVSKEQKQKFDSLGAVYLKQTPYDYALFGMRCGAAAYEILAQLNILPGYSIEKTSREIFVPKKLRKRLFKKAEANNWIVYKQNGSAKRIWEED